VFSARTFKYVAQLVDAFEQEHGGGHVDITLHGEGVVSGQVQTTVITETNGSQNVVLYFADGQVRVVPLEVVGGVAIRVDEVKKPIGFTAETVELQHADDVREGGDEPRSS
jgi:ABC-type glycerol-3-phosphate transport system substrate-binding protein